MEYSTDWEVTGVPSVNFALRRVNLIRFESRRSYFSASQGITCPDLVSWITSRSATQGQIMAPMKLE